MENKASEAELLKEQLLFERKHGCLIKDDDTIREADRYCEQYKSFLNRAKTEREAVDETVRLAESKGFRPFKAGQQYQPGDKVYVNNRGKAAMFAVIGTEPLGKGVKIAASHIDSPRLDLKPNPLYQDGDMAWLKTHYYGGIRKHQWPAMPLSLHGIIIRTDGGQVQVNVGEDKGDPQFTVTDLLPHLAAEQNKKTLGEAILGENLNILIGSRPFRDDEASELVKLNIMKILNEKYGIVERDFMAAELEAVPAFKAVDIGFDRSMIGSYGQDDRVCSYAAFRAATDCPPPACTVISVLADKEEVGSDGNTGLNSSFLKYFICDLAKMQGADPWTVLSRSECLSADVSAGFDPNFPDVLEKRHAGYLNYGVCLMKYTGARGKGDTSDASAEFVSRVYRLLDEEKIPWQVAELGRVDLGGGGTVAKYIANLDVDVVDIGVPVLSMHSPFEIASKLDAYMLYLALKAFYNTISR